MLESILHIQSDDRLWPHTNQRIHYGPPFLHTKSGPIKLRSEPNHIRSLQYENMSAAQAIPTNKVCSHEIGMLPVGWIGSTQAPLHGSANHQFYPVHVYNARQDTQNRGRPGDGAKQCRWEQRLVWLGAEHSTIPKSIVFTDKLKCPLTTINSLTANVHNREKNLKNCPKRIFA